MLHDRDVLERFLARCRSTSPRCSAIPTFFLAFRRQVVPLLRTYPFIRIWHAGCSTGEEVYSMAILLEEEGLYERCRIYATDMNDAMLEQAREGIFPLDAMQEYTHELPAGRRAARRSPRTTPPTLRATRSCASRCGENIVFSQHNLVSDGSFNEFNVILCRNVMIYFNQPLQRARRTTLFYESLGTFGILGLGEKESLALHAARSGSTSSSTPGEKLYRRIA